MTERLYYTDSYLRQFRARVVDLSDGGRTAYLDRTAFYPASGGQPHDTGWIGETAVEEVVDEGERIAHRLTAPLDAAEVDCRIDWARRLDHMQQHSGQHLLSAVFIEQFGIETCSFHLGEDISTIELETPTLDTQKVAAAELRANEAVCENRPIAVTYADANDARDLRKPAERSGTLRIVSIQGLDRIACGGTHVHLTGEIGPILIRRQEKIRNNVRVEFLCGMRSVRRARSDYDALARLAQTFSTSMDETAQAAAAQMEGAREAERLRRKLEAELARYQGRELYDTTPADGTGVRRVVRRLPNGSLEGLRALAQSFTAGPQAVFLGAVEQPPSVLLAVSADAGIDAGKTLQALVAQAGGRGGGSPRMAQGSVPNRESLEMVLQALSRG